MRVDRIIAIFVTVIVILSSLLLAHAIYLISFSSSKRQYDNGNDDDDGQFHHSSSNGKINKVKLPPGVKSKHSLIMNNNKKKTKGSSSLLSLISSPSSPSSFSNAKNKNNDWKLSDDEIHRSCSDDFLNSLPTYDDFISATTNRRAGGEEQEKEDENNINDAPNTHQDHHHSQQQQQICDSITVPFGRKNEAQCLEFMTDPNNWESVKMIEPKFEQRTVKYVVTLKDSSSSSNDDDQKHQENNNNNNNDKSRRGPKQQTRLLMKVPQQSFATEPFAEITAFAIDRALKINRIPPTVLVPFPLHRLETAAAEVMSSFRMVMELGYKEENFTKWWESEFHKFVLKTKYPEVLTMVKEKKGKTGEAEEEEVLPHVWVSLQIMVEGVVPLLESAARVPYSKKMSGWHRWFNPRWEGFSAVTNTKQVHQELVDTVQPGYEPHGTKPYSELLHASMLALSELAIFDFILLNNDRSPNKNNFVVEGCYNKRKFSSLSSEEEGNGKYADDEKKFHHNQLLKMKPKEKFCSKEQLEDAKFSSSGRERAKAKHSLTFVHLDQGMSFHGFSHVNNPIAKKFNNTFCMFYRPLMERIRCFLLENNTLEKAEKEWRRLIPDAAEKALGRKKVKWMIGQLTLLIEKKNSCVEKFGEEVVIQPMKFPQQ